MDVIQGVGLPLCETTKHMWHSRCVWMNALGLLHVAQIDVESTDAASTGSEKRCHLCESVPWLTS